MLVFASVLFPPASFVFCGLKLARLVACQGFGLRIGFIRVKRARAGLGLFFGSVKQFHEFLLRLFV